jgi:hypothetical protein
VPAAPFRLVFAGGTCLARAYKLVQRMSEDVDFKIVLDGPALPSANQLRRELGVLRDRITAALQAAGFAIDPADTRQVRSRDANRYTAYQLVTDTGTDGEIQAAPPLRPSILVELSFAELRCPTVHLPISSFVADAYGRPPEFTGIACASITETAAEKLVSLTRRTAMEIAGLGRGPDPTLVRHIYDLHAVREHVEATPLMALAREIAQQDAQEFGHQHPAYRSHIAGETRKALDVLRRSPWVRERYTRFVAAMVYGEPFGFDLAMGTVGSWVDGVWPPSATTDSDTGAP